MAHDEIAVLLRAMAQAFDAKSWHGTNLLGSVRRLTAEDAAWRPSPDRHSVHDLVVHCAYWKYAVRRRITGEQRGSFYRKGSNFFAAAPSEWKADLAQLAAEHTLLLEIAGSLKPADLDRFPAGSKVTVRDTLHGIAAHDLYHAGQIQLLKRLRADSSQPI